MVRGDLDMSFRIGRIISVDIRIHFTWFFIFVLITWTLAASFMPQQFPNLSPVAYWVIGAVSAIMLFASVLFHELFHSYVALRKGIPVPNITLFLFGGVSQIAEEPDSPDTEFKMAIVGPLSSFTLGGFLGVIWYVAELLGWNPLIIAPLNYGFLINVLLGGFNLLPAFPLDGGRILRAKLWSWKRDIVGATRISTNIGTAFAYGIMMIGFLILLFVPGNFIGGIWLIFIGWFLKSGADSGLKQTIAMQALSNVYVEEIMNPKVITIKSNISIEDAVYNYFNNYKHGGFPVLDDEELKGIITVDDIKKISKDEWPQMLVKDIMTPSDKLLSVRKREPAIEALFKFSRYNVGRFPVLEQDKLVGIITRSDLLHAIRLKTQFKIQYYPFR